MADTNAEQPNRNPSGRGVQNTNIKTTEARFTEEVGTGARYLKDRFSKKSTKKTNDFTFENQTQLYTTQTERPSAVSTQNNRRKVSKTKNRTSAKAKQATLFLLRVFLWTIVSAVEWLKLNLILAGSILYFGGQTKVFLGQISANDVTQTTCQVASLVVNVDCGWISVSNAGAVLLFGITFLYVLVFVLFIGIYDSGSSIIGRLQTHILLALAAIPIINLMPWFGIWFFLSSTFKRVSLSYSQERKKGL